MSIDTGPAFTESPSSGESTNPLGNTSGLRPGRGNLYVPRSLCYRDCLPISRSVSSLFVHSTGLRPKNKVSENQIIQIPDYLVVFHGLGRIVASIRSLAHKALIPALRDVRRQAGLSQQQVAKRKPSRKHVFAAESGWRPNG